MDEENSFPWAKAEEEFTNAFVFISLDANDVFCGIITCQ
jgi:hypothetical protein